MSEGPPTPSKRATAGGGCLGAVLGAMALFFACFGVTTGERQLGCLAAPVAGALIGAIIGAALGALVRRPLPATGTAPGPSRAGTVVLLIVGLIVVGYVLGKLAATYLPEGPTVTSLDYSVRYVVTSGLLEPTSRTTTRLARA
jgi:tetrahydromethanopterin S-methyltransferase subunit C